MHSRGFIVSPSAKQPRITRRKSIDIPRFIDWIRAVEEPAGPATSTHETELRKSTRKRKSTLRLQPDSDDEPVYSPSIDE